MHNRAGRSLTPPIRVRRPRRAEGWNGATAQVSYFTLAQPVVYYFIDNKRLAAAWPLVAGGSAAGSTRPGADGPGCPGRSRRRPARPSARRAV